METKEAQEVSSGVSVGYLTPQEAAARKGVTVASIYKAIERGQIKAEKVLNRVALSVAAVDAYQPGTYTMKNGETIQRAKVKRGDRTGIPQSDEAKALISAGKRGKKQDGLQEGETVTV